MVKKRSKARTNSLRGFVKAKKPIEDAKKRRGAETRLEWIVRNGPELMFLAISNTGHPASPHDLACATICAGFWPDGFDQAALKKSGGATIEDVMAAETALVEDALRRIAMCSNGAA